MTNPVSYIATNLTEAYDICDPVKQLQGEDLVRYYIPLVEARNTEAIGCIPLENKYKYSLA